METEKLITVTGRGNIHVAPDVTRVEIKICSLFDTYQKAYKCAQANLKDVADVAVECGLDKKLPKTIRFDINKETHNVYDRNDHFDHVEFDGYKLRQHIKVDLGMDNELLAKFINKLGNCLTDFEMEIGHTVRDPRPSQLKMLERAVKDATEKAKIMAQAAGCQLGLVKSIDYTEHEIHIYSQAREIHECPEAMCCDAASLDITPDDLCAGEDVTVTWYLSNAKSAS
ncbi:MAG: SIMPL domain-containing protein [Paludibacteraceae bacterium]|nr:SIMPL domain-containing protein [Paludibacteraceae bacterium]